MNLYSINTIKQELQFFPLIYSIKKSDYSESLILTYSSTNNPTQQEFLSTHDPILSNWMEISDYDTEEKESLSKTFDILLASSHLPGIENDNSITNLYNFLRDITSITFSDLSSSVLDVLKECFDPHPVLAYLYPHYYELLHLLYLYTQKACSVEEASSLFSRQISDLLNELLSLKSSYNKARVYTQAVLIEPYTESASIQSSASAAIYLHTAGQPISLTFMRMHLIIR